MADLKIISLLVVIMVVHTHQELLDDKKLELLQKLLDALKDKKTDSTPTQTKPDKSDHDYFLSQKDYGGKPGCGKGRGRGGPGGPRGGPPMNRGRYSGRGMPQPQYSPRSRTVDDYDYAIQFVGNSDQAYGRRF